MKAPETEMEKQMDSIKLEKMITENMKSIFGFALTRLGNVNDAEYLASDILYQIMKSAKNLKEEERFYGFIWKIAENVYMDYLRKKSKNACCIAELDETAAVESGKCSENAHFPPLSGMPILVKDNIDVKGFHTTAGSLALADNMALNDAPIIQNLRRNGAVIIGKSNMTEFANYVSTKMPGGYSSRGGQVIHAVKSGLDPLGSSTGSAVAVAAGIVPMAVGTDTSHSITACAMGNGICGLKPPAGVLSQEGIIPISKTFDSAGAMAQNVSDTLKLYSAMRDEPLPEITQTPAGKLRISVNIANADMNPQERRKYLDGVIETLRNNGVVISEVNQPPTPELPSIMKREFGTGLEAYLIKSGAKLKTLKQIVEYYEAHPDTMMKYGCDLLRGALYDSSQKAYVVEEYQKAMKSRANELQRITKEISDYDAVLMNLYL